MAQDKHNFEVEVMLTKGGWVMADTFEGKYTTDFFHQFITILQAEYPAFDSHKFMDLIHDDDWEMKNSNSVLGISVLL